MFILHSSNKTENLLEHLAAILTHDPLSSPFAKEVFVIQGQGLERWLSQQLAEKFDVWANYEFLFPWKFFSLITSRFEDQVNNLAFDRNQLQWRLEGLLRQLNNDDLLPLNNYLAGSNQVLKRFQLAKHLAQIFDQYQIMRTDLLTAWQNNKLLYNTETERWQKLLWQGICAQINQPHRGEQWQKAIATLNAAEESYFSSSLPERVSFFGINTMPPLFLKYLHSLSRHCQIHLYLLNPAEGYWADLAGKRLLLTENGIGGHPLLTSLGQQGREFQELLVNIPQFDYEPTSFTAVAKPNNLQQLQNDLLNNNATGKPLTQDHSISLHACHSRKREVEVLKDQLLLTLEDDNALELRDILVITPKIQHYEPYISAVFHDIQHSMADRSLRQENHFLDVFLRFLALSQSRLGWQSVLELLEYEPIHSTFGLSSTDLDLIKYWVQDINVRWGQSAEHKHELGFPPLDQHTWQAALDRLFMGYAVGADDDFVFGVLPYRHIEGSSASALGGLNDYLQLLFKAKADFKQAKSLKSWSIQLAYYAEQLFGSTDQLARQPLNELFMELSVNLAEFHHEPVELPVIMQWLESSISEHVSVNGFLRGQLTFCSMIPMRAIPFKVIALLGMNEGEFPKIDRNPTFDLISQHFRLGDRSRRADDRYQFLELLLSARQKLIITFIGQSQATNAAIPPSVVVNELLDVLKNHYQLTDLVTYHPLQAFSPNYFNGQSGLSSFSQTDCAIAQALTLPKTESAAWWRGSLQTESEEVIEIDDLFRFFQHPQRYFIHQQMGIHLNGIFADCEEREPFSVNSLPMYGIQEKWIAQLLLDKPLSLGKLKAQGQWLPGAAGDLEFERQQVAMIEFVNRIKAVNAGSKLDDIIIDNKIGNYRLVGKLTNRHQHGHLLFRYANLKGKDFINAWLMHLIINLNAEQTTFLLTADENIRFTDNLSNPNGLPQWLEIYQAGKRRPDAFFTEAALAYIKQTEKKNARKPPLAEAIDDFSKSIGYDNEYELRQLYGDCTDLTQVVTEAFAENCEALLVPVWKAVHEN